MPSTTRNNSTTPYSLTSKVRFPNDGWKVQIRAEGSNEGDHYLRVDTESKSTLYGRDAYHCDFSGDDDDTHTLFRWYNVPDPSNPLTGEDSSDDHQSVILGISGERLGHGDCIFVLVCNWSEDDEMADIVHTVYVVKLDYMEYKPKNDPPWPDVRQLGEKYKNAARFKVVYIPSNGQFLIQDYVPYETKDHDQTYRYLHVNHTG